MTRQYAVNIADWSAHRDVFALQILLQPVMNPNHPAVECEKKRIDGMGAILDCPEERAQAICEVIRLKIPKHKLRLYQRTKSRWTRI